MGFSDTFMHKLALYLKGIKVSLYLKGFKILNTKLIYV